MTTIKIMPDGFPCPIGYIHMSSDKARVLVDGMEYDAGELRAIAAALTEAADKLEPKAEPKFKVGDRVQVTGDRRNCIGLVCSIIEGDSILVDVGDAREWFNPENLEWFDQKDLEPAPEPAPTPATADTTAWWEAYLAALPACIEKLGATDPEVCSIAVDRAAAIATAAVDARRKMMERK